MGRKRTADPAAHDMRGMYMPVKCRWCSRIFIKPDSRWQYKIGHNDSRRFYCSYACLKAARRWNADKDRHRKIRVRRAGSRAIRDAHDRLCIESGEEHELWEWADIFGVSYYDLWEKTMEFFLPVDDALDILLGRKAM